MFYQGRGYESTLDNEKWSKRGIPVGIVRIEDV
jgi:hypothetical protein